jgi:hypothetical protein
MSRNKGKVKKKQSKDLEKDLDNLIEAARKQPGVQELMTVYETWRTLDTVTQSHKQAMGIKRIISISNVSVS